MAVPLNFVNSGAVVEPRAVWSALRLRLEVVGRGRSSSVGVIASGVSALIGPSYTTTMQFFVSTAESGSTSDAFQGNQFAQQRVASYTGLLTGDELATRVIDRLDLTLSPDEVAGDDRRDRRHRHGAHRRLRHRLLAGRGPSGSPWPSADGVPRDGRRPGDAGQRQRHPGGRPVHRPPRPGVAPSPPLAVRNVVLGALLGLLCGAGLAVARVLLDRSVTDPAHAEQLTGAPAIGLVFRDQSLDDEHTIERVGSRTAEQYRQLATSLQYLNVDAPPKVIMVSSAVPAEGKTTMAINLAIALAEAGHRVTVVEADLRRPKVVEYLDLVERRRASPTCWPARPTSRTSSRSSARPACGSSPPGPTPPNPGRLLGSSQMAVLLDQLRRDNDYVLVDAAPLLPVADSRGLAAHVDGVLLSVRHGSTTKDQLSETAAALDGVGATTLGVVLNMVPLAGRPRRGPRLRPGLRLRGRPGGGGRRGARQGAPDVEAVAQARADGPGRLTVPPAARPGPPDGGTPDDTSTKDGRGRRLLGRRGFVAAALAGTAVSAAAVGRALPGGDGAAAPSRPTPGMTVLAGSGIDPSGGGDSTSALQSLIDESPEGAALWLPAGRYLVDGLVLRTGQSLTGPPARSYLGSAAGGARLQARLPSQTVPVLVVGAFGHVADISVAGHGPEPAGPAAGGLRCRRWSGSPCSRGPWASTPRTSAAPCCPSAWSTRTASASPTWSTRWCSCASSTPMAATAFASGPAPTTT